MNAIQEEDSMQLRTGLELNYEGRVLAWALDYPGCFAYGDDEQEALVLLPQAFIAYQHWVNFKAGEKTWLKEDQDIDVRLLERCKIYLINENYEVTNEDGYSVNAWFQNDWLPLKEEEVAQGLMLMDWSRNDLLDLLAGIPDELREKNFAGERWNVLGVIRHIGGAEWWYLDRLGLTDLSRNEVPNDPFERLDVIRKQVKTVLPGLIGKDLVKGKEGEFWSPRKLLRRVLWHEKDHIHHIYKLIS
jgi:hypothetical protein